VRSISDKSTKPNRQHSKNVAVKVSYGTRIDLSGPPSNTLLQHQTVNPVFSKPSSKEIQAEENHQRSIDNWRVKGEIIISYIGQVFAFVIVMFGLYIAWDLGKSGNPITATIIAALNLGALAGLFLVKPSFKARNQQRRKSTKLNDTI
jgi:hypothetical protein